MAIKSGFFNSNNGDRRYLASSFAEYFATFISNGVFPNPSNGCQIIASDGMNVVIKPGKAWINGYFLFNDADYQLTLDVADGVLNRIDRVVLQLNFLNREIGVVIKKGTPASTPVAPVLQRDVDVYEIALADIAVNKGVISISQSNISDLRLNTEYCGVVHGLVDQVDTTTLYNQYLDFWTTWKDQKVGEFTEFQMDSQTAFNEQSSTNQQTFDGMIVAKQSEFETWFDSVKGMLEGDVAANLTQQIQSLQGEMVTLNESFTSHKNEDASLTQKGHVQLSSAIDSESESLSATPKAVKLAYDLAQSAFQSASNGKELIGTAITGVDSSLVVPENPTFEQLANIIGSISTGKKWASGNNRSSLWTLNVTGLDFQPSFVVAQHDEYTGLNIIIGGVSPTTKQLFNIHKITAYNQIRSDGNFISKSDGFVFNGSGSCGFNANHNWIAFE